MVAIDRCLMCKTNFGDEVKPHRAGRQYPGSPFCRSCVDGCHEHKGGDHACRVDEWRAEGMVQIRRLSLVAVR